MTDKERLETQLLRYQLLVNGLTYLTVEKGNDIENAALAHRVQSAIKDLIREQLGDRISVGSIS